LKTLLTVQFFGAGRKGSPFRGWAGPVVEWPERSPPKVDFGKWVPDRSSSHNGGTVTFEAEPFALIMWGANSKAMRPQDKTTKFGFAGLDEGGRLRAAPLPENTDAREIFLAGGWKAPSADELAARILQVEIADRMPARSFEGVQAIVEEARAGFGLSRTADLVELAKDWPVLRPVADAFQQKEAETVSKQDAARQERDRQLKLDAVATIQAMKSENTEITIKTVAAKLGGESPDRRRKLERHLKQIFPDGLTAGA